MKTSIFYKNGGSRRLKAFSLVELVVVVLIIGVLAVAIFAGGSAAIQKSRVSRTTSDLHNFQVAAEMTLNENPHVANIQNNSMAAGSPLAKAVAAFDNVLASDYKLVSYTPLSTIDSGNLKIKADTTDTGKYAVFQSKKLDAWDNSYYVVFDSSERHDSASDFSITVASAGPNSISTIGGEVETDDLFMLAESTNNAVSSRIFDTSKIGTVSTGMKTMKVSGNSPIEAIALSYTGDTGLTVASTVLSEAKSTPVETSNEPEASEPEHYTISWVIDGATVTQDYEAGATPSHADPVKDGYVFTGWSPAIISVTGNATYTAQFEQVVLPLSSVITYITQCEGGAQVNAPSGLNLKIRKYYYDSYSSDVNSPNCYVDTPMTESNGSYYGYYGSGGYAITAVYDASGTYSGEVKFHTNISHYNFPEPK